MIKKILLGIWVFYLTNLYSSPAGKWITSKNKNDAFEKFSTQDNLHNYIIYLVVIVIITLIVIRILKFFELPKKLKYFRRRAHSNLLDEPKVDETSEILAKGLFDNSNITIQKKSGVKEYPDNAWELIDTEWEAAHSISNSIKDYPIYGLISISIDDDNIKCDLQKTSYKAYFGTNIRYPNHPFIEGYFANAVSIHILLETRDNQILTLFRTKKVLEDKNHWEFPNSNIIPNDSDGNNIEIFEKAMQLLKNNFAISERAINSGICLGLSKTVFHNKYGFLFYFKLSIMSEYLLDNLRKVLSKDYEDFTVINKAEIADFVKINKFTPASIALLKLYMDLIYEKPE